MAKATKGNAGKVASKGKGKPAAAGTLAALLPVTTEAGTNGGTRYNVGGHGLCSFLRALGHAGIKPSGAKRVLAALQPAVPCSGSTVGCQVGAGGQLAAGKTPHHPGKPAVLTAPQLAACKAAAAAPPVA